MVRMALYLPFTRQQARLTKKMVALVGFVALGAIVLYALCLCHAQYMAQQIHGSARGALVSNVSHVTQHLTATTERSAGCTSFPDSGTIGVVVKTGATVAPIRLLTQLGTTLRCVLNLVILSDLRHHIGTYEIYDVLSSVSPAEIKFNQDFEIYRVQQEYLASGREEEIAHLRMYPVTSDHSRARGRKAPWVLDKYKFLRKPALERSVLTYADICETWLSAAGSLCLIRIGISSWMATRMSTGQTSGAGWPDWTERGDCTWGVR